MNTKANPADRTLLTRRELLIGGTALAAWSTACARRPEPPGPTVVNDIHSQLNRTRVHRVVRVESLDTTRNAIRAAQRERRPLCIAGGRHAMGGQQFAADGILLDTTRLKRVLQFDAEAGLIEVEAGIQWPELIDFLTTTQRGRALQWGIIQKQTGADRLSVGGALAANVHGRGLRYKPLVSDVEAFVLVDAEGTPLTCSRRENTELFQLAIGGYGLFGAMTSVTLRLAPRRKLQRVVEILDVDQLVQAFESRIAEGFLYGDFQYATDPTSGDFLQRGVFSCYRPVDDVTPIPPAQKRLSVGDWRRLLYLSHADKKRAFDEYAAYYLSTSGQVYWSDTHQSSVYLDNYHAGLDRQLGASEPATEMITELYVPRPALTKFLAEVREDFRANAAELIYGTIRLIERDDESFLTWATQPYACVIFNLHVVHTPSGLEQAGVAFRRLIDSAIRAGGSYFLTYHRWATRQQVEACYPQFPAFLRLKRLYDPQEQFQSDWYRHYRSLFADVL